MPDRYIHTQGVKTTGVYNSYAMHVRLSKNMYVLLSKTNLRTLEQWFKIPNEGPVYVHLVN